MPINTQVESTQQPQTIASVRVYPGANGSFTLFQDDGTTYRYESGVASITNLIWDEDTQRLKHEGSPSWSGPDESVVMVVGK